MGIPKSHVHSLADNVYMLLMISPLLITLWFALAVCGGSYEQEARKGAKRGERIFRPPLAGAIAVVTVPVWITLVLRFMLLDWAAAVLFWRAVPSHPQIQQSILLTALVIAGTYGAVLLWFQKKWLVALDLEQQTWRSLDLSKFPWRVRTGLWSELGGVQVMRRVARSTTNHYVQLGWRQPSLMYGCLGKFNTAGEAERFSARMVRELDLPWLPPQDG